MSGQTDTGPHNHRGRMSTLIDTGTLSVVPMLIDGLRPSGTTICLSTPSPRGRPSLHGQLSHRGTLRRPDRRPTRPRRRLPRMRPLTSHRTKSMVARRRRPMKNIHTTIIRTSR